MRRIKIGVLGSFVAAGLALAGCQSPPVTPAPVAAAPDASPQSLTPPPDMQKTPTAGPVGQGGAGRYMDRAERGLRSLLRGRAIRVMRRSNALVVVLPTGRMFTGMQLTRDGDYILHQLARTLRFYDHLAVKVNGYTDTHGSFDQNVTRSQHYAAMVQDRLRRDGVVSGRIEVHGFGETDLLYPTGDNVREPRNNRIELVMTPTA